MNENTTTATNTEAPTKVVFATLGVLSAIVGVAVLIVFLISRAVIGELSDRYVDKIIPKCLDMIITSDYSRDDSIRLGKLLDWVAGDEGEVSYEVLDSDPDHATIAFSTTFGLNTYIPEFCDPDGSYHMDPLYDGNRFIAGYPVVVYVDCYGDDELYAYQAEIGTVMYRASSYSWQDIAFVGTQLNDLNDYIIHAWPWDEFYVNDWNEHYAMLTAGDVPEGSAEHGGASDWEY